MTRTLDIQMELEAKHRKLTQSLRQKLCVNCVYGYSMGGCRVGLIPLTTKLEPCPYFTSDAMTATKLL